MSRHQYDLVQCMKLPGPATGYLCSLCEGRCPICDSFVKSTTKVRICAECSTGRFANKCINCGHSTEGGAPAYYCLECVRDEKDREGCPRVLNVGSTRTDMIVRKRVAEK